MDTRLNIGIYIGKTDTDIAAWLNMLKEYRLAKSKWIAGLIVSYLMGKNLPIGTVSLSPPPPDEPIRGFLFGVGYSSCTKPNGNGNEHGWHVHGPGGKIIVGSVVNVCISTKDLLPVLDEIRGNGRQLSTFVKALIRKNLVVGSVNIPPSEKALKDLMADFIIECASNKTSGIPL